MEQHNNAQNGTTNFFAGNPMLGIWAGFWQRYYDNSIRMMSIWMNLPGEIMATNRDASSDEDRLRGSMKAYEGAINETQQVTKDTANAAFEAGNKTKNRMAG